MTRLRWVLLCGGLFLVALNLSCGGSSSGGGTTNPQIGQMYVALNTYSKIERFHMSDNGDPTPLGIIQGFNIVSPRQIALDVPHDRLYVCDLKNPDISVLDGISTRTGGAADRQIIGTNTTLTNPLTPAIDLTRDLLYVSDNGHVLVFASASTANGNVAPARIITPAFTAYEMVLDPADDRLFILETAGIAVFDHASTLNGAVVPDREITSSTGPLSQPEQVALDTSGRLIVTASNGVSSSRKVYVFANAATANGDTAPIALSIVPIPPVQIAVSPAGDLYAADIGSVDVYAGIATANGPISPSRTIQGPNSNIIFQFGNPAAVFGIAIDPTR